MSITVIQPKVSSGQPKTMDSKSMNGYLVLQSIDPTVNRFRGYSISITTIQTQDTIYIVRTAWGRISNLYQSHTRLFSNTEEATQYIYKNLLTRKRHGYSLLEKSNDFPSIELLHDFSSLPSFEDAFSSQLLLF